MTFYLNSNCFFSFLAYSALINPNLCTLLASLVLISNCHLYIYLHCSVLLKPNLLPQTFLFLRDHPLENHQPTIKNDNMLELQKNIVKDFKLV